MALKGLMDQVKNEIHREKDQVKKEIHRRRTTV